jgi:hypothetical protein
MHGDSLGAKANNTGEGEEDRRVGELGQVVTTLQPAGGACMVTHPPVYGGLGRPNRAARRMAQFEPPMACGRDRQRAIEARGAKKQKNRAARAQAASPLRRTGAVQTFIRKMVKLGKFSPSLLRRSQNKDYIHEVGLADPDSKPKPSGLHISEMFDASIMIPGAKELPEGTHGLKLAGLAAGHVPSCKECLIYSRRFRPGIRVSPKCYFSQLVECVRCGWNPPFDGVVKERYDCSTGNKNTVLYEAAFDEQMDALLQPTKFAGPVLVPYTGPPDDLTLNRLGLNLKASDLARARVQTGISVSGPGELAAANQKLVEQGQQSIKARLTTDATGSGVNGAAVVPPFTYPTVHDAVAIMQRNDWLGKGDVARYYMLFPLAAESQHWFGAVYKDKLFWFTALFFGFAAAAFYASVWSAELRRWVLSRGVHPVHMMDDWFVSERTEAEARAAMAVITALFLEAGIHMAPHKFEFGQRLVFLGIMFDSIRMSMSFDAVQCQDFARTLRSAEVAVAQGHSLTVTEVSSIAGKVNWYSQLMQVGRLHDSAIWEYLTEIKRGHAIGPVLRQKVLVDFAWWCQQLDTWGEGNLAGNEFPILSASELLSRPDAIEIIQSDASGPDGCGYRFSSLADDDSQYVSRQWRTEAEAAAHSTAQELVALLERVQAKPTSDTLVVWVSDSASAVFSINKGKADEAVTLAIVTAILEECDRKRFQLVGLWIPRHLNQYADHLSHLAHRLGQDSVTGWTSDLDGRASERA